MFPGGRKALVRTASQTRSSSQASGDGSNRPTKRPRTDASALTKEQEKVLKAAAAAANSLFQKYPDDIFRCLADDVLGADSQATDDDVDFTEHREKLEALPNTAAVLSWKDETTGITGAWLMFFVDLPALTESLEKDPELAAVIDLSVGPTHEASVETQSPPSQNQVLPESHSLKDRVKYCLLSRLLRYGARYDRTLRIECLNFFKAIFANDAARRNFIAARNDHGLPHWPLRVLCAWLLESFAEWPILAAFLKSCSPDELGAIDLNPVPNLSETLSDFAYYGNALSVLIATLIRRAEMREEGPKSLAGSILTSLVNWFAELEYEQVTTLNLTAILREPERMGEFSQEDTQESTLSGGVITTEHNGRTLLEIVGDLFQRSIASPLYVIMRGLLMSKEFYDAYRRSFVTLKDTFPTAYSALELLKKLRIKGQDDYFASNINLIKSHLHKDVLLCLLAECAFDNKDYTAFKAYLNAVTPSSFRITDVAMAEKYALLNLERVNLYLMQLTESDPQHASQSSQVSIQSVDDIKDVLRAGLIDKAFTGKADGQGRIANPLRITALKEYIERIKPISRELLNENRTMFSQHPSFDAELEVADSSLPEDLENSIKYLESFVALYESAIQLAEANYNAKVLEQICEQQKQQLEKQSARIEELEKEVGNKKSANPKTQMLRSMSQA